MILSLALAGFSGVDSSIIYLSCEGDDTQKAFGIYNSMGMAGLLFAAGVFSVFVRDNYSLSALLTVISYGIAAFLSFLLTEVKPSKTEKVQPEPFHVIFKEIFFNRTFVLFLIAVALFSEVHQTITVFLNQLQYEQCGLSSSFIGLAAISCFTLALTQYAVPSIIGILTLRTSNTLFQPLQTEIQNREIKTHNRATALSINSMLLNCVAIGTNLIFGVLSEWNLSSVFFGGAVLCAVSLIFFFVWYKKSLY
jgi:hypothetical protein